MEKLEIKVSGMMCAHCEKRVEDAVKAISGVSSAKADHVKGVIVVEGDGVSEDAIKSAVRSSGYEA